MGKSSINGLFSMAMLNNQRVYRQVMPSGSIVRTRPGNGFCSSARDRHRISQEQI